MPHLSACSRMAVPLTPWRRLAAHEDSPHTLGAVVSLLHDRTKCDLLLIMLTRQFLLLVAVGLNLLAQKDWTAAEDHQNMMDQLGIKALRPGPSGNESAPNHANYDEATANPFPNLPDVLTLKNGKRVTSAKAWWDQRRPEIVEDFEREVLGRIPKNVPKVSWEVTKTAE